MKGRNLNFRSHDFTHSRLTRRIFLPQRLQRVDLFRDRGACSDDVLDDPLVDIEVALILAEIADFMAFGKNAPHLRSEPERVRQHLKNDVAVRGAETVVAKRGET